MAELSLPSNISISFPEGKEKPTHFEIVIRPDEGLYK
jgi:ubiquitin-conjugating enzyme E2 M